MPGERPFTVETAADHLDCSESLVRKLCAKFDRGEPGGLRNYRLGGKLIRIPAAAIEEYEQCASSGSETASTPTGEREVNRSEPRSELRIVRLPSDG